LRYSHFLGSSTERITLYKIILAQCQYTGHYVIPNSEQMKLMISGNRTYFVLKKELKVRVKI